MNEQVTAVRKMQGYISSHLSEEISLGDLSRESCYSPWYSYRLFQRYLGLTPADYVRKLRLSKSALKLRDESVTITEVAFEFGFNSVDGYQRAFYREFGCNPSEYEKSPVPLWLFQPYGIQDSESEKEEKEKKEMKEVKNVFIQVIEKPARKVVVKRGVKAEDYFSYCEEVGCDVWGLLTSMKSLCGEPVCLWLPKKYVKPNTSIYVQGVEGDKDFEGAVPEGFDVIDLPAAKYMMFQGEPFAEEDYGEAIEDVWEAIKRYDPKTVGYEWDDSNPRIQLEPRGERGYIELLSIK